MGHNVGDELLCDFAKILKLTFEKRFDKKAKVDKRETQRILAELKKEAEKQAMEDNPFAALLHNVKFDNK